MAILSALEFTTDTLQMANFNIKNAKSRVAKSRERTTLNPSAFGANPYSACKISVCTKYIIVPREMRLRESFDVFFFL